jgi:hypothetical protein
LAVLWAFEESWVDIGEIIFSHILPAVGYLRASWAKPVAIEAVL